MTLGQLLGRGGGTEPCAAVSRSLQAAQCVSLGPRRQRYTAGLGRSGPCACGRSHRRPPFPYVLPPTHRKRRKNTLKLIKEAPFTGLFYNLRNQTIFEGSAIANVSSGCAP